MQEARDGRDYVKTGVSRITSLCACFNDSHLPALCACSMTHACLPYVPVQAGLQ